MHYKWMYLDTTGTPNRHLATVVAKNTDFDTPIDEVIGDEPAADSLRKDMERGYLVDMGDMQRKYLRSYSVLVPTFAEEEVKKDDDSELGQGVISKIDEERQMVFGWAYVTHDKDGQVVVDKSGEFIDDVEEIEKAAYKFVMHSRAGDFDHTNMKSSEMVESMVFTPEKIEKMGLPAGIMPSGWWVGFHFEDKDEWAKAKLRKSFSIHGKGTKKEVDD